MISGRRVLCFLVFALGSTFSAHACSTPVFQYALQRWEPDYYRAYVFHRGDLSDAQIKTVKALEATAEDQDAPLNLGVGAFDIAGKLDEETSAVYSNAAPGKLPAVVLAYPYASQIEEPFWSGPLSMDTVKMVSESAVCARLRKLLTEGTATVWVYLESGNRKLDESTFKRLDGALREVTELVNEMVFDDNVPGPPVVTPDGQVIEVEPAKFSYSLTRVDRDESGEQVLVASLLGSEPDLAELEEPMVFPVFGRGRALCAFVGDGINSTNILAACEFIGGPCSCQVKAMNPGFDLLIAAYWDDFIDHMGETAPEPPPELTRALGDEPALVATSVVQAAESVPVKQAATDGADTTIDRSGMGFLPTIALVFAGMLVLVLTGAAMFTLRARRMKE